MTVFSLVAIYLFGISRQDIRRHEISNFAPVVLILASPFISTTPTVERMVGLFGLFLPLMAVNFIELLTCDTNGLVFDGSQEPILQSEQYTYRKFVRMMSLSSVFKQDEAAMKNAMGRISGTIPYCPKAAEYLNQGTLLTKGVDDRTYNTTIKSLAEIIMKEE